MPIRLVLCPMIGLLGTVTSMIGAFNVLTESGMGGIKRGNGAISVVLYGQQPRTGGSDSHPDSLLHLQTKFGNIVAEVNQVAGEMVFADASCRRGI